MVCRQAKSLTSALELFQLELYAHPYRPRTDQSNLQEQHYNGITNASHIQQTPPPLHTMNTREYAELLTHYPEVTISTYSQWSQPGRELEK